MPASPSSSPSDRSPPPWSWLESLPGPRLIELASGESRFDAAAIERLRAHAPPEVVRLAIELVETRRRAASRLVDADRLLLDRVGTEQATSTDVARWKARRFAAAGLGRVLDLCCGIGGDAMGLALEGIAPILVDRSRARLIAARHNVEVVGGRRPSAILGDVESLVSDLPTMPVHLDPDRRASGRRSVRLEDMSPGPSFLRSLVERGGPGAVKLAPGVDLEALPSGELEGIQRGPEVVQVVLWIGALAEGVRRATVVPIGTTAAIRTFEGTPVDLPIGPTAPILHTTDPVVERVGLLGTLARTHGLTAPHEHAGFLTGPETTAAAATPWLVPHRLIEEGAGRIEDVRGWLRQQPEGTVVVRTRGVRDGARWQRAFPGRGPVRYQLFVTREGRSVRARLARALADDPG